MRTSLNSTCLRPVNLNILPTNPGMLSNIRPLNPSLAAAGFSAGRQPRLHPIFRSAKTRMGINSEAGIITPGRMPDIDRLNAGAVALLGTALAGCSKVFSDDYHPSVFIVPVTFALLIGGGLIYHFFIRKADDGSTNAGFPEKVGSKGPMGVKPLAGKGLSMGKKRYIKHSQEIRGEMKRLRREIQLLRMELKNPSKTLSDGAGN